METKYIEQIQNIISNFEETKKYIPYILDLQTHPIYGNIFNTLTNEENVAINEIIQNHIIQKITNPKTKGGELFKRFFESNSELFRKFRELNGNKKNTATAEFQKIGKEIEQEMFKLEGVLTHQMLKKPMGLEKTVSSFYDIVYKYFPLYNCIE